MAGYIALVHKDEGTSYGVSFPDLPSCISAGDTFEEAVANAAEAIAAHLALMRADGEKHWMSLDDSSNCCGRVFPNRDEKALRFYRR
jgi:predicted RNase H-like HicB family nuclease